jgi:hypothetical protein
MIRLDGIFANKLDQECVTFLQFYFSLFSRKNSFGRLIIRGFKFKFLLIEDLESVWDCV